eukprot:TRINITY_DN6581_c0_g1_i4.p2 TRINITY_DN6581_c0_g1~~TRINITY_DN6581_c0_g1_i4.p2  ORF type:complete len:210 (-),score=104.25 TRINITY_DN6581_c0_g1_i4:988-1617(-)
MGENPNAIEDEYIENLQQQIHFMELELKLLKEKQDEEEKSGGAGGLFVDEKTAGQHLTLLKEKYQRMHKELERKISDLTQHRNELQGASSTLKQQLANVTQQFKELEDAKNESAALSEQQLDRLESEYKKKNHERSELEQYLKGVQDELRAETESNMELKEQTQEKDMKDKSYQERIRGRLAQQEKLIGKLRGDLDALTEDMVASKITL